MDTRVCADCKIEKGYIRVRYHGIYARYNDENGFRWNGIRCYQCYKKKYFSKEARAAKKRREKRGIDLRKCRKEHTFGDVYGVKPEDSE